MTEKRRHFVVTAIALFAVYLLFSEVISAGEMIAGAVFALVSAGLMISARAKTRRRFAIRAVWLVRVVPRQMVAAVRECWPLLIALGRPLADRQRGIGTISAIPFDGTAGRTPAEAAGRRALVTMALCFAPNSVVIEVEMEPGHLLIHQLVATGRPPGSGDPVWPV